MPRPPRTRMTKADREWPEPNIPPLDLEAVKAREKAATPGPWYPSRFGFNVVSHGPRGISVSTRNPSDYDDPNVAAADADFIARARTDIPQLVAEVERLQAELQSRNFAPVLGGYHANA